MGLLLWNLLNGDEGLHLGRIDIDHLFNTGDLRIDQVIAQEHGERFVSHRPLGTEDSMAEPQRLFLPDGDQRHHLRDPLNDL
jgi:hypothetical protein